MFSSSRSVSGSGAASLQRLVVVGRTLPWAALLGGAVGCAVIVAVASRSTSPLDRWPGLAAAALCAGAAFLLDDAAGSTADATPTSLARRRMLRVALALPLLCAAWIAALWVATPDGTPFGPDARGGLSVQFAAMLALTLAGSAIALRAVPEGHSGWAGTVVPFALLAVAWWLPERLTLLAAPGDDAWASSQARWVGLLILALLTLAWASRDPAGRVRGVDRYTMDRYRRALR